MSHSPVWNNSSQKIHGRTIVSSSPIRPAALDLAQQGQASWIAGMTKLCVLVNGMRRELRRNEEFGVWWDGIQERFISANKTLNHMDRAAAVYIGEHEASAQRLFETTERRSLQLLVSSGELLAAQRAEGFDSPPNPAAAMANIFPR